jgi:hypothetical protein
VLGLEIVDELNQPALAQHARGPSEGDILECMLKAQELLVAMRPCRHARSMDDRVNELLIIDQILDKNASVTGETISKFADPFEPCVSTPLQRGRYNRIK